jgi:hypothetical protein
MDSDDLRGWFGAYLEVFEACGRGAEDGIGRLLDCYDVPFVLSTDDGVLALTSEADVTRALQLQMRPVTTAAKSRLRRHRDGAAPRDLPDHRWSGGSAHLCLARPQRSGRARRRRATAPRSQCSLEARVTVPAFAALLLGPGTTRRLSAGSALESTRSRDVVVPAAAPRSRPARSRRRVSAASPPDIGDGGAEDVERRLSWRSV